MVVPREAPEEDEEDGVDDEAALEKVEAVEEAELDPPPVDDPVSFCVEGGREKGVRVKGRKKVKDEVKAEEREGNGESEGDGQKKGEEERGGRRRRRSGMRKVEEDADDVGR